MIKKLIPLLFLAPIVSIANDLYDPTTGSVHMPTVIVGSENYSVNMDHQGDLVFKVTSAIPSTLISSTFDTFNSETGALHMPFVSVGPDNFEVDMLHLEDLLFKVTKVTPIIPTYFKFSTEWLNGRTLYNVFWEDNNQWEMIAINFTGTTWSAFQEEIENVAYTITDEGYLSFTDPKDNQVKYIRGINKTDDYIDITWNDNIEDANNPHSDDEFFYFNLQKAQAFIAEKNSSTTHNAL